MYGWQPYGWAPYAAPLFPASSSATALALAARSGSAGIGRASAAFAAVLAARSAAAASGRPAASLAAALSALAVASGIARAPLSAACALSARSLARLRGGIGNNLLQLTARGAAILRAAPGAGFLAPLAARGAGVAGSALSALRTSGRALAARAVFRFVAGSVLRIGPSPMPPLIDDAAPPSARGLVASGGRLILSDPVAAPPGQPLAAPGGTPTLSGPAAGTRRKATDTGPLKG
jgi:hypothetical protein